MHDFKIYVIEIEKCNITSKLNILIHVNIRTHYLPTYVFILIFSPTLLQHTNISNQNTFTVT